LTTGFFYFFSSGTLRDRAVESIFQLTMSINSSMDNEIQQMDDISKRVAYSNLLKERYIDYLQDPTETNLYLNQTVLRDIFIAIMGPLEKWYQINLYDFEGSCVGAGNLNSIRIWDVKQEFWYEETMNLNGARYLTAPYIDTEGVGDPLVVSLTRVYYDNYYVPIGIIEIQYEVDHIIQAVLESVYSPGDTDNSREVYVFGPEGSLIYPFETEEDSKFEQYYQTIAESENRNRSGQYTLKESKGDSKWILTAVQSDFTEWHIVVAEKENDLLQPLNVFTRIMLIFCLIAIVSSLFITFIISNRLSRPIKQLEKTVSALTLESFPEEMLNDTKKEFNEIESLLSSFRDMYARLRQSANELVTAQSGELESRMMALQAKMNPHFLYNTIATINVLADEQGNQEIKNICKDMSGMLRYISSESTGTVLLKDEIEQTERYLNLMKHRYEGNLEFLIEVDKAMLTIPVPRLIIQPFVENSLKYGISRQPPWKIRVTGVVEEDRWIVEIGDSGLGFTQDRLNTLNKALETIELDKINLSRSLEGMGIINIYTRMKLLYRDDLIFKIGNSPEFGARILIGGPMPVESENSISSGRV